MMEEFAGGLWRWLVVGSVQCIALASLVWLIDRVARFRVWPQLLWTLWLLVLIRPLVPPSVHVPSAISLLPSPGVGAASGHAIGPLVVYGSLAVWVLGLVVIGAVLTRRYAQMRRELLDGTRSGGGELQCLGKHLSELLAMKHAPQIRTGASGPVVVGVIRPVVIVPSDPSENDDTVALTHVLAHEFAHIKRRDHWFAAAELCIAILFWFSPAVWLAQRRLRQLREVCCDRDACIALGSDSGYRSTLADHAASLIHDEPVSLAFGGGSAIADRLRWLLRPVVTLRFHHRIVTATAAIAIFGAFLPAAAEAERQLEAFSLPRFTAADGKTVEFNELEGCVQTKFAIFAALAEPPPEPDKNREQ